MERVVYEDTGNEPTQSWTDIQRNDGQPSTLAQFYYPASPFISRLDKMKSEVGWNSWHSCSHYQRKVSVSDAPIAYDFLANGYWYRYSGVTTKAFGITSYGSWDCPNGGLPQLMTTGPDGSWEVSLPTDWKLYEDRSLRAMLPGIRPNLSLVNSLWELKDFRTLPLMLSRMVVDIRRIQNWARLRRLDNRTSRRQLVRWRGRHGSPFRILTQQLASVFLQEEFNIRPLLSDIAGVHTSVQNIKRQIEHLMRYEGQIEKRHYSCALSGYDPTNTEYNWATQPGSSQGFHWKSGGSNAYYANGASFISDGLYIGRDVKYDLARFNATIEYSYTLTGAEREQAQLRGLLDALGVNFNPAILWNAYPWTFVFDWVFGVSQWLDQFKERMIEPRTVIHKYCSSLTVKRHCNTTLRVGNGTYHNGMTVPAVWLYEEAYRRVVSQPDWQYSFQTSGINPREFILSSALAASRR